MEEKIKNIVEKYLNEDQVLIDVMESFESGFVRVVIDSEATVTLGDTAILTKKLIKSDEFNNRYPNGCRIEITSPGVDAPLKKAYQFKKNINKNVKIRYRNEGQIDSIKCKILSADDDSVLVNCDNNDIPIFYDQIEHAKILLAFK
ncbi:MAG: ribosome maturation factor RimP [Candidatus Neomarinimicrobiota bacterium]